MNTETKLFDPIPFSLYFNEFFRIIIIYGTRHLN